MHSIDPDLKKILTFWFEELSPADWFASSESVDQKITAEFSDIHAKVATGEYWKMRTQSPEVYLAEVIVLDQFSRNLFRGTAEAFAYDRQALVLAQVAIMAGYDKGLSDEGRQFLYLPFMHSESRAIHEEAIKLFESLGNAEALQYEKIHKDIIDRFGRYPHRNEVLGRQSTPEETEYLANNQEDFF